MKTAAMNQSPSPAPLAPKNMSEMVKKFSKYPDAVRSHAVYAARTMPRFTANALGSPHAPLSLTLNTLFTPRHGTLL